MTIRKRSGRLTFTLGIQTYGADVLHVQEVLRGRECDSNVPAET